MTKMIIKCGCGGYIGVGIPFRLRKRVDTIEISCNSCKEKKEFIYVRTVKLKPHKRKGKYDYFLEGIHKKEE